MRATCRQIPRLQLRFKTVFTLRTWVKMTVVEPKLVQITVIYYGEKIITTTIVIAMVNKIIAGHASRVILDGLYRLGHAGWAIPVGHDYLGIISEDAR